MRAALYTRVSTDTQVEEGYSLDAQLARLRAFCESQDWTIVGVYPEEGQSAKNIERPMLQQLLADIEADKIDLVLVYRLDRLTRNVIDLHKLLKLFEKHNVGFRSATEIFDTTTATGRLFITLVASLAQWERENLGERVRFTMRELASKGRKLGGHAAFGYAYQNGQLEIDETEAETVREIFSRYLAGDGIRKLLQWLNDPSSPQPAPNNRWTMNAVRYLLDNPLYAGYIRYGYRNANGQRQASEAILVPGQHEPIIEEETWQRAKKRRSFSRMNEHTGRGKYSLKGLLRCGLCGSAMGGGTKYRTNKQDGHIYRFYICYEKSHSNLCSMPRINADSLETAVLEEIERHYIAQTSVQMKPSRKPSEGQKRVSIDKSLEKIEIARKRWLQAYQDGHITAPELREQLDTLYLQREGLEAQKEGMKEAPQMDPSKLLETVKALRASWEDATTEERRGMLSTLIDRIEVTPGPNVQITFKS